MKLIMNNKKNFKEKFLVPQKLLGFQGKKGILQILEAAFAVIILIGFTMLVFSKQIQKPDLSESIYKIQHQVLREISDNYTLRNNIIQGRSIETNNFVKTRLSAFSLNFSVSVCNPEESCPCACPGDRDVYADDIIISTNLSDYSPKKLSLFIWAR